MEAFNPAAFQTALAKQSKRMDELGQETTEMKLQLAQHAEHLTDHAQKINTLTAQMEALQASQADKVAAEAKRREHCVEKYCDAVGPCGRRGCKGGPDNDHKKALRTERAVRRAKFEELNRLKQTADGKRLQELRTELFETTKSKPRN